MSLTPFVDRSQAGRLLGARLRGMGLHRPVVLGIPRGGVIVAAEVAHALRAPLDVIITKKIGAPSNPEFAIGAVTEGGALLYEPSTVSEVGASWDYVQRERVRLSRALEHRAAHLRHGREAPSIEGCTAIVVDDGLATGWTMKAALMDARARGPRHLVAAVPVGSDAAVAEIEGLVDVMVCLSVPEGFSAVGEWFVDFAEVSDDEVVAALDAAVVA